MKRYRVEFLPAWGAERIEKLMNERADEGYRVMHFSRLIHPTATEEIWTTVVFEREQRPEREKMFSEEMALEWTRQPGDDILLEEMRAAVSDDARPLGDPLLDGGLER